MRKLKSLCSLDVVWDGIVGLSLLSCVLLSGCEADFISVFKPADEEVPTVVKADEPESVDEVAMTFKPCPLSGCGPFSLDVVEPSANDYLQEGVAWRYDAMPVSAPTARYGEPTPRIECRVTKHDFDDDTLLVDLDIRVYDPIADLTPNALGSVRRKGAAIETVTVLLHPNTPRLAKDFPASASSMKTVGSPVTVDLEINQDKGKGFWRPHPYVGTPEKPVHLTIKTGSSGILGLIGQGGQIGEGMHLLSVHTSRNLAGRQGATAATVNIYRDKDKVLHAEIGAFESPKQSRTVPLTMRFSDARVQDRLAGLVGKMTFAAGPLQEDGYRYIGDENGNPTLFYNTLIGGGQAALVGYDPRRGKTFTCPYDPRMGDGQTGLNVRYGTY